MKYLRTAEEAGRLAVANDELVRKFVYGFFGPPHKQALLRYLGSDEDALQIGREGLLAACRLWDPETSKLSTFAYYRIRAAILDVLRRGGLIRTPRIRTANTGALPLRMVDGDAMTDIVSKEPDPAKEVCGDTKEDYRLDLMRASMNKLHRKIRSILLSYYAGETYEEIGLRLGMTKQNVFSYVQTGLTKLRRELRGTG